MHLKLECIFSNLQVNDWCLDYFLEDIVQLIRFIPAEPEAKKGKSVDDDEGAEISDEVGVTNSFV